MVKTNLFGFFWGSVSLWVFCLSCTGQTQAQVVPDSTLPVNSAVTVDGNTTRITGGTRAGSNLFHSFEQFSVTTNGTAFFDNAVDIQNILTRVTGGSISNIDGLIQANGGANLFLLNPNGIVFGPNASLNIGGSFLASTASSLVFADGNFSATDPNNTPLLSVNVPLGVQFGASANAIANRSRVTDSNSATDNSAIVGLRVNPGQTLALLGGDLNLEGGHLNAPAGRIELGSVAPNSQVNLTFGDTGLALGYEGVQDFQDIRLSQQAVVSTGGTAGGDIQIQARELSAIDSSTISAVTIGEGKAGNISIQATDRVEFTGTGKLRILEEILNAAIDPFDLVGGIFTSGFVGGSGDLTIDTKELVLRNGAVFSASTFANGPGGSLNINTQGGSVELIGSSLLTGTTGLQDSGDLSIDTGQLTLKEGAVITTATALPQPGAGDGGDLIITADSVELTGVSTGPLDLPIFVEAEKIPSSLLAVTFGAGNAGNVQMTTRELKINEGGAISSATLNFGQEGKAGNISIQATDRVEVTGTGEPRILEEILNETIDPSDLFGGISTSGFSGGSGDLTIYTKELVLRNGAVFSTSTFGSGPGGSLNIDTQGGSVELIGSDLLTGTTDSGDSGDLTIATGQLTLREGAVVSTATVFSEDRTNDEAVIPQDRAGNGGNLIITADSVELTGESVEALKLPIFVQPVLTDEGQPKLTPEGQPEFTDPEREQIPSSLLAVTFGDGNSGNVDLTVRELKINRGGAISTATLGLGDGGDIIIRDAELVELIGTERSRLIKEFLTTGSIDPSDINDGFFSLSLPTPENAEQTGAPGSIEIETQKLTLENGAGILATTFTRAQGADLSINATESIELSGGSVVITGTGSIDGLSGAAGNLTITTGNLTIRDAALVSTATFSNTGEGGNLTVTTPATGRVELIGAPQSVSVPFDISQVFRFIPTGLQTTSVGNADAGDLTIETGELIITEGASAASATLVPPESEGQTQGASASTALDGGSGGKLTVNADSVNLIGTSTDGLLPSSLFAFTETNAAAGSLEINAGTLIIRNGAVAQTDAFVGTARGGNVTIDLSLGAIENSSITSNAQEGDGGDIRISARAFFEGPDSEIDADSLLGTDGSVSLNTPDIQASEALVDLPETVTDPAEQVAQVCQKDREGSSFTIAGRGGLPPRPSEPLSSEALVGFESLSQSAENIEPLPEDEIALAPPARGWFVNDRGELVLTSQPLNVMSQPSSFSAVNCHAR
jgi:filamentous hemagglutinin family protein